MTTLFELAPFLVAAGQTTRRNFTEEELITDDEDYYESSGQDEFYEENDLSHPFNYKPGYELQVTKMCTNGQSLQY